MIGATVGGDHESAAALQAIPANLRESLAHAVAGLGGELADRVRNGKLSGQVLGARTGRLRASIEARVRDETGCVALSVGSDAPYAAIHEFGGVTPAHEIRIRKAQALAFMLGGRPMFARRIRHPGSRIPARPFLRPALGEMGADVRSALREAVAVAVRP